MLPFGDDGKNLVPKETADKLAASCAVIDTVSLPLPEKISKHDKDAVAAIRKAYDELTEDQKKLVPKAVLERLTAAEKKLEKTDRKNVLPWIFAAIAAVLSAAAAVILIISQKRKRRDRAAVMPTNTD